MAKEIEVATTFVYDPASQLEWGLWQCAECKWSGGTTLHRSGCSRLGQESVGDGSGYNYIFGPKEVEGAKMWAETSGEDMRMPLGPLSLRLLRQRFPELL